MKVKQRLYVEIDASLWIDADGLTQSIYMGDASDPVYEKTTPFFELVDSELDAHTVNGVLTRKHGRDNIKIAEYFVTQLEDAAEYARKRFEGLKDE